MRKLSERTSADLCVNFFTVFIIWDHNKSRIFVLNTCTTILSSFDFLKSFSFVFCDDTLVLTFFGWRMLYSVFSINASKQWQLVALTRKLAVFATFFGDGFSNCCSSLLNESSVEDWLEFWSWKRGLLTKLSNSCLKL